MSIKPFDGGALKASSSKCTTGFVLNGESGLIVMKGRQPLFWTPNQRVALPKAVKVVMTPAIKVKGRKRNLVVDTLGRLLAVIMHHDRLFDVSAAAR